MTLEAFNSTEQLFVFHTAGDTLENNPTIILWGHGWGQTAASFDPLVESVGQGRHILFDLPGFGRSSAPPESWGTAEYADGIAGQIRKLALPKPIVWIGHSFGCRIGIQLAARHPDLVERMVLIAGAGLPRRRSLKDRIIIWCKVRTFKILSRLAPVLGLDIEALRKQFGSADYRNAGALRRVFLRVIQEDLTAIARRVSCPVQLIYGTRDTETPPEIGERFARLMPNAKLALLPEHDHYTVLGSGRHLVASRIRKFLEHP